MTKKILWITVLLWMILVFCLSSQPAEQSDKLSKGVTEIITQAVKKVAPRTNFDLKSFNHIVRKNTHFFAYLILGILVINSIRNKRLKYLGLALLICILYAISDEFHQLFVPGRGAQVRDVIIDSTGAATGIVLYITVTKWRTVVKTNNQES